jgi:hypothetical protein
MNPTRFTVAPFLDPDACRALIDWTESLGYEAAPITTLRGFEMRPDIRNNTRVMVDDPRRAAALWERLRPHARAVVEGPARWEPVGLNERLRFYRYTPGQHFRWHMDGAFIRSYAEQSLWTFMVYLNDDFEGGATEFFRDAPVRPQTGAALVFDHELRHQGGTVIAGTKYVLRSDVMFRRAA